MTGLGRALCGIGAGLSNTRRLAWRLLPSLLWAHPAARAQLKRWLLLGLLLRLLFMPFAAHNDYLSEHWRAEQVAFHGVVYPMRLETLSHYIDALALRILAPLIPEHGTLFRWLWAETQSFPGAGPLDYAQFVEQPQANRALFLTKIPYLVFDLIAAWILLHLFADVSKAMRAFKYWLLNPVIIFAVYIFGRYEVYALVFVLLGMLLLQRGHPGWGAVMLGIAILTRTSTLLLVPIYAMAAARRWSDRLLLGILSLLPTVALILFLERVLGWAPSFVSERQGSLVLMLLRPLENLRLYPYVTGYVLTVMALHFGMQKTSPLRRYAVSGLFVYLLMLAFSHTSVAYYAWIMPFLVWMIGEDVSFGRYFVLQFAAWSFFWLVATDMGVFTPYLFSPISLHMWQVRPTPFLLEKFASLGLERDQMIYIGRSILAAVSLWMIAAAVRLVAADERATPALRSAGNG